MMCTTKMVSMSDVIKFYLHGDEEKINSSFYVSSLVISLKILIGEDVTNSFLVSEDAPDPSGPRYNFFCGQCVQIE